MKKLIIILFLTTYALLLEGCNSNKEQINPESLVGYIVIEDNTLYLDEVEVITSEDVEKIAELGLKEENDFPNGYYIHNPDSVITTYDLTDETVYNFVDFNLLFINDEDGDSSYTTTKKEEFIQHLSTSYYDEPPAQKVPFFIKVEGSKVISITEKFEFTI